MPRYLIAATCSGLALAGAVGLLLLPGDAPLTAEVAFDDLPVIEIPVAPPAPSARAEEPPAAAPPARPVARRAAASPAPPSGSPRSGSQFLAVLAEPTTGVIVASSNQTCKFWLDGSQRGVARGASLVVAPGFHTVTCRLESGPYRIQRVEVAPRAKVSIAFRF